MPDLARDIEPPTESLDEINRVGSAAARAVGFRKSTP